METIGYILLVAGASILGLSGLGCIAWSVAWIIEAVRKKEFGDVVVPFIFLGSIIFITGIVCVAISETKQKQQIQTTEQTNEAKYD